MGPPTKSFVEAPFLKLPGHHFSYTASCRSSSQIFPLLTFRHVYTGIEKTIKRAIPQPIIRQIKDKELLAGSSVDYARDMFLFSFYTRGMSFVDMAYLKKSNVKDGMLTYISHTSDNNPAVTIKWDKAMQQIANRYSTDTEYMFPIITKEENADETEQIKRSRHNVVYNLRSIGKQYKFSVSPTIAMTKDLWRKIMDEVSVSEVI